MKCYERERMGTDLQYCVLKGSEGGKPGTWQVETGHRGEAQRQLTRCWGRTRN